MITYFFRAKRLSAFSIENIFERIQKIVPNSQSVYVPEQGAGFVSFIANCWYAYRNQTSVNHVTGDIHYIILFLRRKNVNILTIHDCGLLEVQEDHLLKKTLKKWLWFTLPLRSADWVTVISPTTKEKLILLTGINPDKVIVIANPYDVEFRNKNNVLKRNNRLFTLLFIGSTPNKNLVRCIEALKDLPIFLEIVGDIARETLQKLEDSNLKFKQSTNLSKQQLVAKYCDSDALLFPSTYEGFGLPIIEAQAVGIPVITSKLEPMHWVAGERGAIFVNPYDPNDIRNSIIRLLNNEISTDLLIKNGCDNITRFEEDLIVEQYLQLYSKKEV